MENVISQKTKAVNPNGNESCYFQNFMESSSL